MRRITSIKDTHYAILIVYLLGLFIAFAIQIFASVLIDLESLTPDGRTTFSAAMNFIAYTIQAILLIYFFKVYLFKNQWVFLKHHYRFVIYLTLLTLYLMFNMLILIQGLFLVLDIDPVSPNQAALESILKSGIFFNQFSLFVVAVILAPIVEELVYRKAIYGLINTRFRPIYAVLGSAFVFAFVHIIIDLSNAIYILPYFGLGVILSFIYYYSGKIIFIPIIAHALMNLYTYILLFL